MYDTERIVRETFVVAVEHHPTIGSTNSRAAECAAQTDLTLPLLVLADQQTAGRGRGTNRWWTGQGALALSLLVDAQTVGADSGPSPLVALATAVAIVDTIAPRLPNHPVGIHWPNDVLAADRKLAGILIEVLPDRRHVIGIGLNTNNTLADAPPELRNTAATMRDLAGQPCDQMDILIELLNQLEQGFARLRREPEASAAQADKLCLQRGKPLTLGWANRSITGVCRGIALDGALQLETSEGQQCFYSGILTRP